MKRIIREKVEQGLKKIKLSSEQWNLIKMGVPLKKEIVNLLYASEKRRYERITNPVCAPSGFEYEVKNLGALIVVERKN